MPRDFEIRNRKIEEEHRVDCGEVITRKMTPEEWEKYGPPNPSRRYSVSKISNPAFIDLAKKYGLDKEGRLKIAEELGIPRVDLTNYINRPYVKKQLKEAGLLPAEPPSEQKQSREESRKQLINDIAKELDVKIEQPKPVVYSQVSRSPSKTEIHLNICGTLHEVYKAKNAAYGDSFSVTFKEFGIISALTHMSDKWNRIKALAAGARNDVKDESLEDTLLDLANYCIMTIIELQGMKGSGQ